MDAQKFGAFIASVRKEKAMTQAELAQKIQVTDKAVSRWERGLGFPDINSFEPLADALGISVLELMRSEKNADVTVTKEDAAEIVVNTLNVAKLQRQQMIKNMIKRAVVAAVIILFIVGSWMIISGLTTRIDVYLAEYSVMPSGRAMTIHVGVAGSMGYIRNYADASDDPAKMELQFYSAFGGLNSSLGAQNVFILPLDEECTEIYFADYDGYRLMLQKDAATGIWETAYNR